ncbi:hypothetical protein GW17_00001266 [Ensete ventricosum]|nr:hypothetical protein GW17_00001266 [Ensete ventricosum]
MEASEPGRPGAGAAGTGELYGSKGKGSQDPELDGLGLATGKAMNGEGSECLIGRMQHVPTTIDDQLFLKAIREESPWENLPKRLQVTLTSKEEWHRRSRARNHYVIWTN